jgi:hypothetical protein
MDISYMKTKHTKDSFEEYDLTLPVDSQLEITRSKKIT